MRAAAEQDQSLLAADGAHRSSLVLLRLFCKDADSDSIGGSVTRQEVKPDG
jgi:hypothetical protein